MNFTNDEMNLMCIYNAGSRTAMISELTKMRSVLEPDEKELLDLTDSVLGKLSAMSDQDFDALELYPDFDEEDADDE